MIDVLTHEPAKRPAEQLESQSDERGVRRQPRPERLRPPIALPPRSVMYQAVLDRDSSFDGVFYSAIRTTGVFCRPVCGARKPKPQNVEYFGSVGECVRAGYRACKRCKPLDRRGETPDWVQRARRLAETTVERKLGASDLRREGLDPVAAARWFKAHYGLTFQAYHRACRMGVALRDLRAGATIGAAADVSGYESESGFRSAFVSVFGAAPTNVPNAELLHARWLESPLGSMLAIASERELWLLEFVDRRGLQVELEQLRRQAPGPVVPGANVMLDRVEAWLDAYFAGDFEREAKLRPRPARMGSPFERRVWEALDAIPFGETRTYGGLAAELGLSSQARAVGRAVGRNRISIVVPCHRVVGADGSLTGYGGGLWRKRWLLDHETARLGAGNEEWRGGVAR